MSHIEKQIMYHISTDCSWNIGQVINAGESDNPFWNKCTDIALEVTVDGIPMPLHQMIDRFSSTDFGATQQNIDFLYSNLKFITEETSLFIREQVFEDIRKMHFPHRPSRQKCLFTTDTDNLDFWKTMSPNTQRCILTLELTGELFRADEYWVKANTFSSVTFQERAMRYWAGEVSPSPHFEYLFSGEAIIKDISIFT